MSRYVFWTCSNDHRQAFEVADDARGYDDKVCVRCVGVVFPTRVCLDRSDEGPRRPGTTDIQHQELARLSAERLAGARVLLASLCDEVEMYLQGRDLEVRDLPATSPLRLAYERARLESIRRGAT